MSYALNNVTTADGYTAANTMQARKSRRVNLDVSNAAIFSARAVARCRGM